MRTGARRGGSVLRRPRSSSSCTIGATVCRDAKYPLESPSRLFLYALQLDRPVRPLWVYRPVKRSPPNTSGRKPLKNSGLAGGGIGFKSPSSHFGLSQPAVGTVSAFPGQVGFFRAILGSTRDSDFASFRSEVRGVARLSGSARSWSSRSSNLPPSACQIAYLQRRSFLVPVLGRAGPRSAPAP